MERPYKKRKRSGQSDHEKKKIEKKDRCSYIPEDIHRQILLRLPVKSLLRFRFLNKRSHSLISAQQFISDHLKTFQHENKRRFLLHSFQWSDYDQCFQYVDGSIQPVHVQDLAPPPPPIAKRFNYSVGVVGYCDGVVCMIRNCWHILFWNPSIRKMTAIAPDFIPNLDEDIFGVVSGICKAFGFGSVDDEYKFVLIPTAAYMSLSAYIYSLKTRNWAVIKCHQHWRVTSRRAVFVNGACHWLARDEGEVGFVLSFNLKEHTFGKIDLPDFVGYEKFLSVYDGCLSLIAKAAQSYLVWVMKKYGVVDSWIKIMENNNFKDLRDIVGIRGGDTFALGYCSFGMSDTKKVKLACYRHTTKRAQWLKADYKNLTYLHAYQESLVLLNQDSQVP